MASSWGSHAVEAGSPTVIPCAPRAARSGWRPSPRTRDWSRLARRIWARWGDALARYEAWLSSGTLAARSRSAYRRRSQPSEMLDRHQSDDPSVLDDSRAAVEGQGAVGPPRRITRDRDWRGVDAPPRPGDRGSNRALLVLEPRSARWRTRIDGSQQGRCGGSALQMDDVHWLCLSAV
jgi:hypothetical protein